MYFEIYKNLNRLVCISDEILNEVSWVLEPMTTPTTSLTIPATYKEYISGREEIKIFAGKDCFWGIIKKITINGATMDLEIDHVVSEWEYRQISMNNAIKDKKINVIFKSNADYTRLNKNVSPHIGMKANNITLYHEENKTPIITKDILLKEADAESWFASGQNIGKDYKIDSVTIWTYDEKKKTYTIVDDWSKIKTDSSDYRVLFGTINSDTEDKKNSWMRVKLDFTTEKSKKEKKDQGEGTVMDLTNNIMHDANFAYPGWILKMSEVAKTAEIDYVYSRQNKLEALTKTCELTPKLFWRVPMTENKIIEISEFGDRKQKIISNSEAGHNNSRILKEPSITYDFDNVINIATVYSDKSDSGMASITLREVYNDKSLQYDGFPVIILRDSQYTDVNNERGYKIYTDKSPKIAPNNQFEYAVMDEESIALEGGKVIEGTYAFNDLSSFNTVDDADGTLPVTDLDRRKASLEVYKATVRKLNEVKRTFTIDLDCTALDVLPGDRVLFSYDKDIWQLKGCTNYMKKVITFDDWYYVTKIESKFLKPSGKKINSVTLSKYLKIERETKNGA